MANVLALAQVTSGVVWHPQARVKTDRILKVYFSLAVYSMKRFSSGVVPSCRLQCVEELL